MTGPAEPSGPSGPSGPSASSRDRRRRLEEVFGDVLPSQSRDDQDEGEDRRSLELAAEEQLRRDVPPHHGA